MSELIPQEKLQASANVEKLRTSAKLDFSEDDQAAAAALGLVVAGSPVDQISRAAMVLNTATRLAVEAGYNLLAAKAALQHGDFMAKLEEIGFSPYRAAEAMRRAKFVTAQPEERRAELLNMQPSKLLVLADASAEAVEELLEDGDIDPANLGVRALRARVRELEKKAADAVVDRSTAEAEAESLRKKLAAQNHQPAAGVMPVVIKDIRSETIALLKKAELSVESLVPIETELAGLRWSAVDAWVNPSGQLLMAGLVALRLQLDGAIERIAEKLEMVASSLKEPDALAGLDKFEVVEIAGVYQGLIRSHEYEAALRQYERDQEKPKGRGAPRKAPKAPE